MCGLAGFWETRGWETANANLAIRRMLDRIAHRGPDAAGVWSEEQCGLMLGHRRLAILDLSPQGRQPMASNCGRYVIVFNGEIYNYRELSDAIAQTGRPAPEDGCSDTRVLLEMVAAFGLENALSVFEGMFAFALWDRQERNLHLVRDRLGEKPLYYGWCGQTFVFGSELKALQAHPAWRGEIDREALDLYLRYKYVPTPRSIFQGVYKLPPGAVVSLRLGRGDAAAGRLPTPRAYWSMSEVAEAGVRDPFEGDEHAAIEELDRRLRRSVRLRMLADVPLGAFLSGGVDSSTVVAMMQAQSTTPVRTFSIGLHEASYNEAPHAQEVAKHLGAQHTEIYVTGQEAAQTIPELPWIYDEPFADSSQIPTYLVSRLAKEHVTVALSGDGGDELFSGYTRYDRIAQAWARLGVAPHGLRRAAGRLAGIAAKCLAPHSRFAALADAVQAESVAEFYHRRISQWSWDGSLVLGAPTRGVGSDAWQTPEVIPDARRRMMFLDAVHYLPDDILVKVDRASMRVSLESRLPLLDHHVVEFAWRLPMNLKVRQGEAKWVLRRVLERYVPQRLFDRPKMGFGVPISRWLQGPLRSWAEDLISESRLRNAGIFHPAPLRRLWRGHIRGDHRNGELLWSVLVFQAWRENLQHDTLTNAPAAKCA